MTLQEIENLDLGNVENFASFAVAKLPMPGDKRRLDEILNRDIIVTDFRVMKSKHNENKECLQIQFLMDGGVCIVFTGSSVLSDQIQSASDHMPFRTRITKIDKYYSFA